MSVGFGTILPGEVVVSFPALLRGSAGCGGGPLTYEVSVTLAEAANDFGSSNSPTPTVSVVSHPGQKRFRSSATALLDDPVDPPVNEEQLQRLAWRIARDYYGWRRVYRDVTYPGTVAYAPDGTADILRWTYSQGMVETRVTSPPFDCEPEELMHGLPCESGSSDPGSGGDASRRPDAGTDDDFVWVWFPSGGIPASSRVGRRITPASASCEVMEEDEDGVLEPTDTFRDVFNYWSQSVAGGVLGSVRCRRGRLVVKHEDCVDEPEPDPESGSSS